MKNTIGQTPNNSAGKWIQGLDPEMGVSEAAQAVLSVRLHAAIERFKLVRDGENADAEDLRKARVASRRARSAIDAFRSYLPKKASRRLRRRLKSMRNLAGEPRSAWLDRDALCARLEDAEGDSRIALAFATGRLDAHLRVSLVRLRMDGNAVDLAEYEDDTRKCLKRLAKERCNMSLHEHAAVSIRDVEERIARTSADGFDDLDALHQFRIDIKRLRYTYEIFRCCIPDARFDSIYPAAEAVQERLGDMNDLHELVCRVRDIAGEEDPPQPMAHTLDPLIERLESERETVVQSFLSWWHDPEATPPAALRSIRAKCGTADDGSRTLPSVEIERSVDHALEAAAERIRDDGSSP